MNCAMVAPNAVDTWQTIRIIGTVLCINFMGQIVTAVEIQGIFEQLRFKVYLSNGDLRYICMMVWWVCTGYSS